MTFTKRVKFRDCPVKLVETHGRSLWELIVTRLQRLIVYLYRFLGLAP